MIILSRQEPIGGVYLFLTFLLRKWHETHILLMCVVCVYGKIKQWKKAKILFLYSSLIHHQVLGIDEFDVV